MSLQREAGRRAVPWLTAQAFVFGMMAALLGVVANALFLDAYGSAWLPATYLAIGVVGIAVSGALARTAERVDLVDLAVPVLGVAAVGIALAWPLTVGGGARWVSAVLLVVFPILIQLGFVFIGGQAGRLLDIAGIKASFPRITAGFPVGAVVGGLLGGQLVNQFGRSEHLLLAAAVAEGTFAGLVWATSRERAGPRPARTAVARPARPVDAGATAGTAQRPGLWRLLATPFVSLILAYQVLSALGSQLADFLVFDRAAAHFDAAADLARFLAIYTTAMNALSIAFLALFAGPLLQRFGLRLGIAANPVVVTLFAVLMVSGNLLAGGASVALLGIVSAARIADIALTDGTTRTSINAMYQVLPERTRLATQTAVEGIGVPVAIGISGALLLILHGLPDALTATILTMTLVCAVWTLVGFRLYRAYGPALIGALERRPLLLSGAASGDGGAIGSEDEAAALQLLASPDARATQLGLSLLNAEASPGFSAELLRLTSDARPEVRLAALAARANAGDAAASGQLSAEVRSLVADPDAAVRRAALDAVQAGDAFALEPAIEALRDPRTAEAAAGAIGRLGDAAIPALARLLEELGSTAPAQVLRFVRAVGGSSAERDEVLARVVDHRDRELALLATQRLVGPLPAGDTVAAALAPALGDDTRHAAWILGALDALASTDRSPNDAPLRRALLDELDTTQEKIRAGLLARHGSERLGHVLGELAADARHRGASVDENRRSRVGLAIEALDVLLGPRESRLVVPALQPDLSVGARLAGLSATSSPTPGLPTDLEGWLRDLVEDPGDRWRASWVRACAIHAASGRGWLDAMDLGAARALGDAVVDEALARHASG